MSTFAEQIRARVAAMQREIAELELIAAQLEGNEATEVRFRLAADTRCSAVIEAVVQACHVELAVFRSGDRSAAVATARHIAAYALHTLLGLHFKPIAHALGWRSHVSVIHALRNVRDCRTVDRGFAAALEYAMKAAHSALAQLEGIETATTTAAEERIPA